MQPKTDIGRWFVDAKKAGWYDLGGIVEDARRIHGEIAGLWRCEHCDACVVDPCVADGCEGEAVLIYSDDGFSTVVLCRECHGAAEAAREKIVVDEIDGDDAEDWSALSEDEATMADYLERADQGRARQSRDLIRDYPRDERRDLHGYQDDIDDERSRAGKTVM